MIAERRRLALAALTPWSLSALDRIVADGVFVGKAFEQRGARRQAVADRATFELSTGKVVAPSDDMRPSHNDKTTAGVSRAHRGAIRQGAPRLVMDRGVPTEEVLAEMRAADPPVHYLVGTPKGRLTRLEKHLIAQPWQQARPGVQVKLLAQGGELYVLAQSRDRVAKGRAMRRRQLKRVVVAAQAIVHDAADT